MKRFLFASFLSLILCTAGFGQENCPQIGIIGSGKIAMQGTPIYFSVVLSEEAKSLELKYEWTISAGEINQGQGTSIIEVNTKEVANMNISATVEIKGLPLDCPSKFSEIIPVVGGVIGHPLDDYGKLSMLDEWSRLDNLAITLQNDQESKAFIEMSFENQNERIRVFRIFRYLTQKRRIPKEKIVFGIYKKVFPS